MTERLCLKKLHPYADRMVHPSGKTECLPCIAARRIRRRTGGRWDIVGEPVPTNWSQPTTDAEREERYETWAAGVDAAIEAVRRTEGFDGRHRPGQVLGEYLPLTTAERRAVFGEPTPRRRAITRMTVRCPDCDTPRLWGAACVACEQRQAGVRQAQSRTYRSMSPTARRFQDLARLGVGRLVS